VKRIVALLVAVAGALVTCSTALADALTSGHGPTPPAPGQFTPPGAGSHPTLGAHTSGAGTLPFTGFNLAIVAALALLLLVSGLVLHRLTQRRQ
jgi:hypothetical protein